VPINDAELQAWEKASDIEKVKIAERVKAHWAKEKSGVPRGNGWSNSATLTAWRA
jgi:hypothetical protein